ncbi:restriction endonuclease FokI catalytic domain-containing protein [Streptococcus sp. 20-1249]|uniref:restriction endonuclease FokI catalytic domain-containing protein n=1 Tax=Streptococcus hepaticus TaxID=3349163 RepID=UPI003747B44F
MAIAITEYPQLNNLSFGLGQDVSQDLKELVKVVSIFVPKSKIHKWLINKRLKEVVTDSTIQNELIAAIDTDPILITWKQLTGTRTKGEANSLVQAVFPGQGQRLAIVDWAAQNYVSVAVAFGLLEFHRVSKSFTITDLGIQAVQLYESGNEVALDDFLYQRLLEYPYTAWLLRLLGENPSKQFSKFDLGGNFGFIDEPGFDTAPVEIFLNGIAQAKIDQDAEAEKKIKSNFESTSDKYMRWLAGVLVASGLANSTTKKVSHTYNGRTFEITLGAVYQITPKGLTALKQVNGKSRYPRSKKRVMWEFFATKDKKAIAKKTTRSLILKHLSEKKNPLKASEISKMINSDYPSLEVTPEEVLDDCIGINRIGIQIDIVDDKLTLKESLYDFEIPIQKNVVLEKTEIDKFKNKLRSELD